ncbi:MAG TPA: glycosyltransferase [Acidimicrobiia bacterium]
MVEVGDPTTRPLVSIVMPAYNHEQFVAASIESVCEQTYRPLELVVVDDGSSDSTASVVTSLAAEVRARLHRFVFDGQRNRGIASALNRALSHARGEFVATLASDDVYLPHKIERLLEIPDWDDPRTAAAFGDAQLIDRWGERVGLLEDFSTADLTAGDAEPLALGHYMRWRHEPEPGPPGSYASLLRGPYIPGVASLIRRSALRAVGDFDESRFVEDYALWLHLARDHRIVAIPDVVAQKRFHGANVSVVRKRLVFRDMLELLVRERPYARSDPVAAAERAASRDRVYDAVRHYGNGADLLWILARHPIGGPVDLLAARNRHR